MTHSIHVYRHPIQEVMEGATRTKTSAITTTFGIDRSNTSDLFDGLQLAKPARPQEMTSTIRRRPPTESNNSTEEETANRQLIIRIPKTSDEVIDLVHQSQYTTNTGMWHNLSKRFLFTCRSLIIQ